MPFRLAATNRAYGTGPAQITAWSTEVVVLPAIREEMRPHQPLGDGADAHPPYSSELRRLRNGSRLCVDRGRGALAARHADLLAAQAVGEVNRDD